MDRESCETLVTVMPIFLLVITVQVDRVRRVRIQWIRHRVAMSTSGSRRIPVPGRYAHLGWWALYVVPIVLLVVGAASEILLLVAVAAGTSLSSAAGAFVLAGLISSLVLVVLGMLAEWLVVGRFINRNLEDAYDDVGLSP